MPNSCFCQLAIRGTHDEVKRFLKRISTETSTFSFEKIIPAVEDSRPRLWGTPEDAIRPIVDEDESANLLDYKATITFVSAWNPPLLVMREASKKFPDLIFVLRHEESGLAFSGIAKYNAGRHVEVRLEDSLPFSDDIGADEHVDVNCHQGRFHLECPGCRDNLPNQ